MIAGQSYGAIVVPCRKTMAGHGVQGMVPGVKCPFHAIEIECADHPAVAVAPGERDHPFRGIHEFDRALDEHRVGPAEGKEAPVMLEQRAFPAALLPTAFARCATGTGSHGLADEKPPSGSPPSHTIGVRQPSLPLNRGQKRMP